MNASSKVGQRHKPPRKGRSKTVLKPEEREDALDKALQDTYPASDPLAILQPGHKAPACIEK
ncbi:MAG: hypothetical protein ACREYF_04990 [Gammaproteobacteria bacterium]